MPRNTNWIDLKRMLFSIHMDVHGSWARHRRGLIKHLKETIRTGAFSEKKKT